MYVLILELDDLTFWFSSPWLKRTKRKNFPEENQKTAKLTLAPLPEESSLLWSSGKRMGPPLTLVAVGEFSASVFSPCPTMTYSPAEREVEAEGEEEEGEEGETKVDPWATDWKSAGQHGCRQRSFLGLSLQGWQEIRPRLVVRHPLSSVSLFSFFLLGSDLRPPGVALVVTRTSKVG